MNFCVNWICLWLSCEVFSVLLLCVVCCHWLHFFNKFGFSVLLFYLFLFIIFLALCMFIFYLCLFYFFMELFVNLLAKCIDDVWKKECKHWQGFGFFILWLRLIQCLLWWGIVIGALRLKNIQPVTVWVLEYRCQ